MKNDARSCHASSPARRARRARSQRGNALLISLIALTGLATLGNLTVVSVQGGVHAASSDRFHAIALYAAESGGAAAMNYLRGTVDSASRFGALVSPRNSSPRSPSDIPGNLVRPGQPGNLFSSDLQAWYEIQLLNNRQDPGFEAGTDDDAKIIIRAVGHGPDGAIATLEWEVQATGMSSLGRPCPGYGQKGLSEDGAGRNDCMGIIDLADTATYRPGENP
jgi:hypothetical protein